MRKFIAILTAIILTVTSTSALAEWTYLTKDMNKNYDIYVDKSEIRKNGNIVKMWDMSDYKSTQKTSDGSSYLSIRSLSKYDCKEVRFEILDIAFYSGGMLEGEIVSYAKYEYGWQEIPPDTFVKTLWKAACGKK